MCLGIRNHVRVLFLFYRTIMTCVPLSARLSRKLTSICLFLHFRQNDHVMYLSGMSCIWTTIYVSVTFYYCCLYVLTCIGQSCYLSWHTVLYLPFYKFVRSFIGHSCCLSWHTFLYFLFFISVRSFIPPTCFVSGFSDIRLENQTCSEHFYFSFLYCQDIYRFPLFCVCLFRH